MDVRKIEQREIEHIVLLFAIVQIAVIAFALFIHIPASSLTISTATGASGYAPWEIAIGYGLYIGVGGFILWFVIKGWKHKEVVIRIMELFFVVFGIYFLSYLLAPQLGWWLLLPGFILILAKNKYQQLSNLCAVGASIGFGVFFAFEFGFAIMFFFMIVLAVYDFLAVYVTKHMVDMANTYADMKLALLIYAVRRIDSKTVSSIKLGAGDLIFPAAFIGSMAIVPHSLIIAVFASIGCILALAYLLVRVQRTLMPYPAIPYLAAGSFIGGLVGLFVFMVI